MAGTIMPNPKFIGFDNNGDPLSGGKLYTYAAGTTTPQDTYSDVGLSVANTNPVILDSGGRATVFLSNSSYKFVLKDSNDVTIWTQDNISAFNPTNLDIEGTVGEAVTAGQLVYLSDGSGGKTAGKWYLADADFDYASSLPTIAVVTVSAAINASASLRMQGSYTYGSALVAGSSYYVSGTAGALATTPGTYSRFVGICEVDGFTLVFSPNPPNIALSPTFATVTATQAFVLGSATTNGIRMDLNSGTMEIREGDDSAYGPLNVGTTQVSGDLKPLANDGGSLGVSGTAWSDAYLASGGIIDWNAGDTTLTQSAGKLTISGSGAGALDIKGTTAPVSNDGAALGVSGRAWSDAYFASGGVIDWNAGDTTLTQSAGKLTLAGSGAGALDVKGTISPTANDGGSLGVSGTAWADLFLASGGVIDWNAGNTTLTQSAGKLTVGGSGAGDFGIGGTALIGTASTAMYESNAGSDLAANYHLKYTGGGSVTTGGVALTNTATTGMVGFWAENSGGKPIRGAAVEGSFTSVTAGAERSELVFYTQNLGTTAAKMRLTRAGELQPNTNDGATLGASGTAWADLYLASGGVIDWNAGDVTITHSSNTLAFAGASTGYTFADGPITNALGAVGTPSYTFTGDLNTGIWSPTADTVAVSTGGSERMRITSGGVVGIGVTPSAWGSGWAMLQTTGGSIGSSGVDSLYINNNAYFDGSNWKYTATASYAARYAMVGADHQFHTAGSGTANNNITFTERFRVLSGGGIAIGATAKLYLDGVAGTGDTYIYEVSANNMAFYTGGAFGLQIDNGQNVIMKATGKLYLDGGGDTYITEPSANVVKFVVGGTNAIEVQSTFLYPVTDNAVYCGYTNVRWVAVYAVNGTIQTSDRTLKHDITDTTLGLDFIQRLRPVSFTMNDEADGTRRHGLIAQDVMEAAEGESLLGILTGDTEGEYGLNYAGFVPALIKAVQEQQAKIAALEARLN